jgi:hypothetical protein
MGWMKSRMELTGGIILLTGEFPPARGRAAGEGPAPPAAALFNWEKISGDIRQILSPWLR